MSVIPLKLKKETKIREYINQFLINIGQDCDDEWWSSPAAIRALERLTEAVQSQVTDSFELGIDCEDALVVGSWNGGTDAVALDQLMEDVQCRVEQLPALANKADLKKKTVQFLFFTSDLKSRTALEMKIDQTQKRKLASIAKKSAGMAVTCKYTFLLIGSIGGRWRALGTLTALTASPCRPFPGIPIQIPLQRAGGICPVRLCLQHRCGSW